VPRHFLPGQPSRFVAAAGAVAIAVTLAACSSSSAAAGSATVNNGFGSDPTVTTKGKPPATTQVQVVSRGSGAAVRKGDLAVVDDYARTWKSKTPFQDTFSNTVTPDTLPVGTGQLPMSGLDGALLGVPVGSRVVVVIPPSEGFGQASGTLPTGVSKSDTAVFVFDLLKAYPGNAGPSGTVVTQSDTKLPTVSEADLNAKPTITIPKTSPPSTLSVTTLVKGDGAKVSAGQELVVQYVGQVWDTGKEFDSSWKRGLPAVFPIGEGQLIKAWDQGLVGQTVGSRVLIVAPPDYAYGSQGQGDVGIKPTDTLVFVVDILGAFSS
jgi:FKBP-type peptidyl-prolyl cis-trans isomerase